MIIAALSHFSKIERRHENTFKYSLDKEDLSIELRQINNIILAQYKFTIIKNWLGREQKMELLTPLLFDIQNQKVISNSDLCNEIYAKVQIGAKASTSIIQLSEEEIQELSYSLTEEISLIESEILEDHKMRLETSKKMQIQRSEEYYESLINKEIQVLIKNEFDLKNAKDNQASIKGNITKAKNNIENLKQIKQENIENILHAKITSLSPELLSLSLITIS